MWDIYSLVKCCNNKVLRLNVVPFTPLSVMKNPIQFLLQEFFHFSSSTAINFSEKDLGETGLGIPIFFIPPPFFYRLCSFHAYFSAFMYVYICKVPKVDNIQQERITSKSVYVSVSKNKRY